MMMLMDGADVVMGLEFFDMLSFENTMPKSCNGDGIVFTTC